MAVYLGAVAVLALIAAGIFAELIAAIPQTLFGAAALVAALATFRKTKKIEHHVEVDVERIRQMEEGEGVPRVVWTKRQREAILSGRKGRGSVKIPVGVAVALMWQDQSKFQRDVTNRLHEGDGRMNALADQLRAFDATLAESLPPPSDPTGT